jgi:formylglycine-generating enzyme required for sulfatase activity
MELQKNNSDAEAWLNFFLASYYANKPTASLESIIKDMDVHIPGTFEACYANGLLNEYSTRSFNYFQKAFDINPANQLTFGPLMIHYELQNNQEKKHEMALKILNSGYYPEGLLQYNYNVLMSVESNGILFTKGENTTIPAWILQDAMNIRPDVKILNIDLLKDPEYIERVLAGFNIPSMNSENINDDELPSELLSKLPEWNKDKQFYYALTIPKDILQNKMQELYIVGLATRASAERIDNIAFIKKNIEKNFLLDYLTVDFNGESRYSTGKIFNSNYLAPMLILHDHYKSSGESEKTEEIEKIIHKIAAETNKEDAVRNYLNKAVAADAFIPANLDIKSIENNFKIIRGNIYASAHETTNREYMAFLDYLISNKKTDIYNICNFDLSKYDEPTKLMFEAYQNIPAIHTTQRAAENYANFPVINISRQAAIEYCRWLTEQYNNNPKRNFHKIIFRLPTLNEWQIAALGYKDFKSWNLKENRIECGHISVSKKVPKTEVVLGQEEFRYPWGIAAYELRNSPVNKFDCYLGNFKTTGECKCPSNAKGDGYRMMAPVAQYFPNNLGLFDVVGNVAEMIDEEGSACGGSWMQAPEESTIESVIDFTAPNSWTGFRTFMEIIEP